MIDVLADELEGSNEVRATEELSYHLEATNKVLEGGTKLLEGQGELKVGGGVGGPPVIDPNLFQQGQSKKGEGTGGVTIGSLDVVSMFPNLKAVFISKLAAQAMLETQVDFQSIDIQMVGIYLALNFPRTELIKLGLSEFIPIRLVKNGGKSKIKISSKECRSPQLSKEKWAFSPKTPNQEQRKLMLSKAIEVGVRECFRNHLYTFNGEVYRQTDGGPIGLRLSMAISRVVMAMWDKKLMELGSETGWLIHMLKRYVDDVTAVLATLKCGVRWTLGVGLSYQKVWEEEDKKSCLSDDQRTMKEFQAMANTIFPCIQVTFDTCDDHESGMIPVLDLQCWVTKAGLIYHKYYEKPMASKYCNVFSN
jgi:hypothetical protein